MQCHRLLPVDPVSGKCSICSGTNALDSTISSSVDRPATDASSANFHYSDLPVPGGFESTRDPESDAAGHAPTADPPRRREVPRPPDPDGYELIGEIGHGGMGVVYLARELATCEAGDPESGHRVAIKFLMDPSDYAQLERFRIEIKVLRELEHDHFVRVLTSNLDTAVPYFVMEIAGGGGLDKRVSAAGPLDPLLAATWMKCVTEAVATAHDKNILHRDLKPGNILLARHDRRDAAFVRLKNDPRPRPNEPFAVADHFPKVADFGLAKRVGRGDGVTVGNAAMGSPPYMSPEQIRNPQGGDPGDRMSHRADVYSLGATLYHLLCGRPPFQGEPGAVTAAVLTTDPPRPRALRPEIPIALEAVVVKAMQKNPRHRYPTAAAMAEDLGRYLAGGKTVAPQLTRGRRAWLAVRRQKRAVAACALAVTVFVAGGAVVGKRDPIVAEERPNPIADTRKALAANRQAVVIDATGPPRHYRWRLGGAQFGESPLGDKACYYQSISSTVMELLDDPGTDRYTFAVDVMFVEPVGGDGGYGGIYFGESEGGNLPPTVAQSFAVVCRDQVPGPSAPPGASQVRVFDLRWKRKPGGLELSNPAEFARQPIPLLTNRPGPWRRMSADVSPDRITIRWRDAPDAAEVVLADLRRVNETTFALHVPHQPDRVRHRDVPPGWSPRKPLGLWARQCAMSFRNATVTPNPLTAGVANAP